MTVRNFVWVSMAVVASVLAAPAKARADQSLGIYGGYFALRGEDTRVAGDVLNENLKFLSFNLKDLNSGSVGAEWFVGLGDFLEAGAGLGYTQRTAPSVDADFVNADGSEIQQALKLRIVPITATVRFFPFGRTHAVQPYVGLGVGVYNWRYSETGEFVDVRDRSIFRDRLTAKGHDAGPLVVGGIRFGGAISAGGEVRFQRATGTLNDQFAGDRIDLGGISYVGTLQIRY